MSEFTEYKSSIDIRNSRAEIGRDDKQTGMGEQAIATVWRRNGEPLGEFENKVRWVVEAINDRCMPRCPACNSTNVDTHTTRPVGGGRAHTVVTLCNNKDCKG